MGINTSERDKIIAQAQDVIAKSGFRYGDESAYSPEMKAILDLLGLVQSLEKVSALGSPTPVEPEFSGATGFNVP